MTGIDGLIVVTGGLLIAVACLTGALANTRLKLRDLEKSQMADFRANQKDITEHRQLIADIAEANGLKWAPPGPCRGRYVKGGERAEA